MADCNPITYERNPTEVILSEEEKFRLQCEAREDYYRRVGWKDEVIVDLLYTLRQMELENQQLNSRYQQLISENQQLSSRNQQLKAETQQLNAKNQQLKAETQQLKAETQQLSAKKQKLSSRLQDLQDLAEDSGIPYTLDN